MILSPNTVLILRVSLILHITLTSSSSPPSSPPPSPTSSISSIRRRSQIPPVEQASRTEHKRNVGAFGNNPYDDHFIWLWDHNHLSYYPSDRMNNAGASRLSPTPTSSSQTDPNSSEGSNSNSSINNDNDGDSDNNYDNSNYGNSKRKNSNDSSSCNGPSILIVQDASPGPDEEVLYVTSKVNRAYAKRWGFDYLHFTGIAVGGSYSWQATFNKPYLLQKLIQARIDNAKPENRVCTVEELQQMQSQENDAGSGAGTAGAASMGANSTSSISCVQKHDVLSYDIVMFLDSSAIIVQLDFNVISLIQSDKMIATSTSKIIDVGNNSKDADVVIWNLNHPQTAHISAQWIRQCYLNSSTLKNLLYKSQSETLLSKILQSHNMDNSNNIIDNSNDNNGNAKGDGNNGVGTINVIEIIPSPMVDGLQGTLVKQDMSYNDYLIDDSDLRRIMPIVTGIADSVCYRFYPQCEIV